MKLQTLRTCLEVLSFILWMVFTIFSIAMAGLGLEGMILAGFLLLISSTQPVHFPLVMVSVGALGVCLSILWRQVGVDHLHYQLYDSPNFCEGGNDQPSQILRDLIREVEGSAGYDRNEARAKAKAWLMDHSSSLDEQDILLARANFGYLLPAEWGKSSVAVS